MRLSELWIYFQSLSALEFLNATLALLAALVAFGSINLMKEVASHTDVMATIIDLRRGGASWSDSVLAGLRCTETMGLACAFVTFAAGCFGQVFGALVGRWQAPLDTLLFGGALALLIANRRNLAVIGENKSMVALFVTALSWGVFFLVAS